MRENLLGFTLTELIGVLAVIAIIAAALYPVVMRRIDIAAKERERSDLVAISNALVLQIVTKKTVTDETGWANEVATWARLPLNKVTATPRRYARAFLLDRGGWFETVASWPYVQNNWGVTQPTNARIMVVSSMAGALPISTSRLTKDEFQGIWNTPLDAKPTNSVFSTWKRGEDLLIQRISIDHLFHQLVLVNRDPQSVPRFAIGNLASEPLTRPETNYFLNGTEVTLCLPNGTAQRRLLLTRDESFSFNGLEWAGDFYGPDSRENLSQDFAAFAAEFMAAGAPNTALQGANPQGVVVGMFNFALIYSLWANKCPHFPTYNATALDQVPEYALMLDVGGSGNSSFLYGLAGPGGLLK